MRRQCRDEGYSPRSEVCGHRTHRQNVSFPQLCGGSAALNGSRCFFKGFQKTCRIVVSYVFLCPTRAICVFPTASPGFQPEQFNQEEQRAGVVNGETDPDVSTRRGESQRSCGVTMTQIVCRERTLIKITDRLRALVHAMALPMLNITNCVNAYDSGYCCYDFWY